LLVATYEVLVIVADQATRQQVRLDKHLEAVADAEDRHALGRGILHLGHDRRERRDRAGAQVVAVAEAAGQHEGVDTLEVVRAVPEGDRLGAGDAHRALRVAVVQRAREGDDPDADGHSATSTPTTSSMTELESTSSATRRASASTSSVTSPSTVSSKRLPIRTWLKDSTPRRATRAETALPCGSSSSALGMTSTTMVGMTGSGCRAGGDAPSLPARSTPAAPRYAISVTPGRLSRAGPRVRPAGYGRPMRVRMAFAGVALLVGALTGCGVSVPADPHGTMDRVQNAERRAGAAEIAPWVGFGSGDPSGSVPELLREFAAGLGADVEWTTGSEAELVKALERGELDVVVGGFVDDTPWMDMGAVTRPYA